MKIRVLIILSLINVFISSIFSQTTEDELRAKKYINGFAKSLHGEVLPYHSIFPDNAKYSLLTRCTDGKMAIEWLTEPFYSVDEDQYAYFKWIAAHSTGTSKNNRFFDLYINDKFILTFETKPKNYPKIWSFSAEDSTKIFFELITIDRYNDAHGFTYLKIPKSKCIEGEPLNIRIIGKNQNSRDWYMTFIFPLKDNFNLKILPFIYFDKISQPLRISYIHFGESDSIDIDVDNNIYKYKINYGLNNFEIPIEYSQIRNNIEIKCYIDDNHSYSKKKTLDTIISTNPANCKEIYLTHFSHTDIGYSASQEEVKRIHIQNIYNALDLIDKTKDYPDESRFVWNIESSWVVENFLEKASEFDIKRFTEAVKNKSIVLSALYLNISTGISTKDELIWNIEYAKSLSEKFGIDINSAMFTDIPGVSWNMVDALSQNGIRYFSDGPNYSDDMPDKGDRVGNFNKTWCYKPFWWKSKNQKDSILMYVCGKGYSYFHSFNQGDIFLKGTDAIANYINEMNDVGYLYDIAQLRFGIVSDNGPLEPNLPDFVREWNEKYSVPKLIISGNDEFFLKFDEMYGKSLPAFSGDITPYWDDGAYSTAKEVIENKLLSQKLSNLLKYKFQNENNEKYSFQIDSSIIYKAKKYILLFSEHTWGAWNSIYEPDNKEVIHQWEIKKSYIDSSEKYISLIEKYLIPKCLEPEIIEVYNTLNWNRDEYIEINLPNYSDDIYLIDDKNNKIYVENLKNGNYAFIAENLPQNNYKIYHIVKDKLIQSKQYKSELSYKIDNKSGSINELIFNNYQFVKPDIFDGLSEAIYVEGISPCKKYFAEFENEGFNNENALTSTRYINCKLKGTNGIKYEYKSIIPLNYIQVTVHIDKISCLNKESIHVAFPFQFDNHQVNIGFNNSFYTSEIEQLQGSNFDFYCVENWIDISDKLKGITIVCPGGALWEKGEITDEQTVNKGFRAWKETISSKPVLFLYALNNYWHTNFKASQEGEIVYEFYIIPHLPSDIKNIMKTSLNKIYKPIILLK